VANASESTPTYNSSEEGETALEKKCTRCGQLKSVESFYRNNQAVDGLQSWCKECQKSKRSAGDKWNRDYSSWKSGIWKNFRMTPDEYFQLLESQNGVCAICEQDDGDRRLAVDHDHANGEIRGLLCRNCNVCLGLFKDETSRLKRAISYLEG